MCIKEHRYYVCNCKNVRCPEKYTMCCPYGPSPSVMTTERGHVMSNCKSTESPCENLTQHQQQLSICYSEPCKDFKIELVREDIGLCWGCKATCQNKQTGMTVSGDSAALKILRDKEEEDRKNQLEEWNRSIDSDGGED